MITTLDGNFWEETEILFRMMDDDFYYNYLGQNALSSSSVKKLLDSPLSYKQSISQRQSSTTALDFGWLFHASILEPDVYAKQYFVDARRNSNKYKDAKAEHGRVFTETERKNVERLATAFYNNSRATDMLAHTQKEVPAIGELWGIPFRAKADVLGDGYIVDLKTTTDVRNFRSSFWKWGYHCQAFIYCELFKIDPENFWFIAVDKENGSLGFYNVSQSSYEKGRDDVYKAVNLYKSYFVEKDMEVEDFAYEDTL
jgi:hypothetical protein